MIKLRPCAPFGVFSAHSKTLALCFQALQDLQIKTWQASLLHWLSQKPGSTPNRCNIHIPWGESPNWEAVVGGNKYKICYRWLTVHSAWRSGCKYRNTSGNDISTVYHDSKLLILSVTIYLLSKAIHWGEINVTFQNPPMTSQENAGGMLF